MGGQLKLSDAALLQAGTALVMAASDVRSSTLARPQTTLPSLSEMSSVVESFIAGAQLAQDALADAASVIARTVSGVMSDSSRLDAQVATQLGTGFAIDAGAT